MHLLNFWLVRVVEYLWFCVTVFWWWFWCLRFGLLIVVVVAVLQIFWFGFIAGWGGGSLFLSRFGFWFVFGFS